LGLAWRELRGTGTASEPLRLAAPAVPVVDDVRRARMAHPDPSYSFGVLAFWRFGVLAFWRFGVLAFWRFGV